MLSVNTFLKTIHFLSFSILARSLAFFLAYLLLIFLIPLQQFLALYNLIVLLTTLLFLVVLLLTLPPLYLLTLALPLKSLPP